MYEQRWQRDDLITELCARLTRNFSHAEWRNFVGEKEYSETCPGLPVPEQGNRAMWGVDKRLIARVTGED
jgi:hypothetical protein